MVGNWNFSRKIENSPKNNEQNYYPLLWIEWMVHKHFEWSIFLSQESHQKWRKLNSNFDLSLNAIEVLFIQVVFRNKLKATRQMDKILPIFSILHTRRACINNKKWMMCVVESITFKYNMIWFQFFVAWESVMSHKSHLIVACVWNT